MDNYLSDIFYNINSSSLLLAFQRWISTDPIMADGDILASYKQVELAILAIGLAIRGLWVAQFADWYANVPTYILSSPYQFLKYHKICNNIKALISGYGKVYIGFHCIPSDTNLHFFSAYKTSRWTICPCNHQGSS